MNRSLITIFRKQGRKRTIAMGTESVWNLFVQILLPLILILSFLSVMDILRYKFVADVTREENKRWRDEFNYFQEEFDPNQERTKQKISVIEIQKQKLLKALEEVKYEERKTFKLVRFMNGNDIDLESINIADEDFKFLCTNIRENISDKRQKQNYLNILYGKILKRANVTDSDPRGFQVHKWSENMGSDFAEIMIAKPGIISMGNRALIQNEIIGFVDHLEGEVRNLQSEVLIRIFNALIEYSEELDSTSKKLVMEMLSHDIASETRMEKANEFRRRQLSGVKKRLEEYHFIDETWQQIAKIN